MVQHCCWSAYLLQTIWTLLSPHLTRQVRDACISGRLGLLPRQKPKVDSLIPFSFSAEIAAYETCLHKQNVSTMEEWLYYEHAKLENEKPLLQ